MAEAPGGEIVVHEAPDGSAQVDVRLDRDTVWLRQEQMAELFGRERSVVTKHIRNVFKEGELESEAVRAKFARIGGCARAGAQGGGGRGAQRRPGVRAGPACDAPGPFQPGAAW
ncbi:MAG: hypothetical protein IT518_27130 [Burkholderiales bacterium]|nr:hypothetical protein [Burkholderiales bacterium]